MQSREFGGSGSGEEDITEGDIIGSEGSASSEATKGAPPAASKTLGLVIWFAIVAKLRFLEKTSSNVFDSVSRILFPFAFVLFTISYWAHYLSRKPVY